MKMRNVYFVLGVLGVLMCCMFAAGCVSNENSPGSAGVTILQTDGSVFTLPHTAERIVLMNSNAAEMLYVIGAAGTVVGASQSILDHAELGPLFPNAVSVGKWDVPDVELISSLSPDVVIAFASSKPKNADVIEAAGIPIVYIDCYKPSTMSQDVTALGILTGNPEPAARFVTFYDGVMQDVAESVEKISMSPRVYCEGYTAYSAQVNGSGLDLLLDLANGRNVLMQDAGATAPKVSPEWLVAENPDCIVKVVSVAKMSDPKGQFEELVSRTGFSSIDAVSQNRTWLIRNDIAYGPRTFAGAVAVVKMLHPTVSEHLDVRAVLDAYNAQFGLNVSAGTLVYPEL